MNRPCVSNTNEPSRMDAGDAIAAAVERLSASASFVLLCADEHPGVPVGACASADARWAIDNSGRHVPAGVALADLCAHYERLDRMRGAQKVAA